MEEQIRKGFTVAKYNEKSANIVIGQIIILSIFLGAWRGSWWVFGGSLLALIIAIMIPQLTKIMIIIFSVLWAVAGYYVGNYFGGSGASIVLAVIGFLIGVGANASGAQWVKDIAGKN